MDEISEIFPSIRCLVEKDSLSCMYYILLLSVGSDKFYLLELWTYSTREHQRRSEGVHTSEANGCATLTGVREVLRNVFTFIYMVADVCKYVATLASSWFTPPTMRYGKLVAPSAKKAPHCSFEEALARKVVSVSWPGGPAPTSNRAAWSLFLDGWCRR